MSFNIPSLLLTKKYTLLIHGRVADPSMLRLVPLIHGLVSAPSMLHGVFLAFFLFASLASMQHWRARIKPVSRVRMRVLFSEQRCLLLKYNLLTRKVVSNIPLFARQ